MQKLTAECILEARATLGEGPSWDEARARLSWVDIEAGQVHRFDPVSRKVEVWPLPAEVGFAARTLTGDYLCGTRAGLMRLDPGSGRVEKLLDPETHLASRFNDGKCDAAGRLWAGTISDARKPECALYRIDLDLSIHPMVRDVTNSNGLAWSRAGDVLYYIDTATRRVDAFRFDSVQGTLHDRRTVIEIPEGLGIGKPDGMAIDAEGMLWIGMWGGGRVTRWDPSTGNQLAEILLPCEQVTSCCFGGPDLEQLFITTARKLDESGLQRQPLAGGLFVCTPGVAGLLSTPFGG